MQGMNDQKSVHSNLKNYHEFSVITKVFISLEIGDVFYQYVFIYHFNEHNNYIFSFWFFSNRFETFFLQELEKG